MLFSPLLAEVWIALKVCGFQSGHVLLQVKLFWSFLSIGLSFEKVGQIVLYTLCFHFVPKVIVNRITTWGWFGPFRVLDKLCCQFFIQEILNNIETMWWLTIFNKNPSVVIHNTIDYGKKLFFLVFIICFEIVFHSQKTAR